MKINTTTRRVTILFLTTISRGASLFKKTSFHSSGVTFVRKRRQNLPKYQTSRSLFKGSPERSTAAVKTMDDPNSDIDLSKLVFGSDDALFGCIERNQRSAPLGPSFGSVLDAGTGSHSLRWIASLVSKPQGDKSQHIPKYTAVTADETMKRNMLQEARSLGIASHGEIIIGNWNEENKLCNGETYDTILADYLVGALDGFSPYYQDRIFPRLAKHLKENGRLYVVGLNPIPDKDESDADIFCRVTKLRDACILLAGHRCYREYPVDWVERHLKLAGLKVIEKSEFPIMYSYSTILRQLNVARSKLPLFPSKDLAKEMGIAIDELDKESKAATNKAPGGLRLGFDYVITAEMPMKNE